MHIIRHFVSPSSGHRHVKFTEMSFLDSILLSYGAHESCSTWSSSTLLSTGALQIYSYLELIKFTLTWISSNLCTLTWISSNLLSPGSPQNYSNLEHSKLTLTWSSSKLSSPGAHQKKGCAPQCRTGPADPDNMSSLRPFINTS